MGHSEAVAFERERSIRRFQKKIFQDNKIVEYGHQVRIDRMGRLEITVIK
jgi:hypothetical protein